ncbi:MAG TPA: archaeosine biosynthesis radical SAM protein RaSEA [Candidatus Thermoplasmatota archaeon]|nr:archaeosine biosynthesis radical SAM protein RaSEA [Candidatus Thermoplasmatota archaeon]
MSEAQQSAGAVAEAMDAAAGEGSVKASNAPEAAALKAIDYERVNKDLNKQMRELRGRIAMRWDPGDLTEYIRCWSEDDVLDNRPCKALVVILKTRGCTWALAGGCTMCGYANESAWQKVGADELVAQFERAWRKYEGEELVKIYTSGSFLDRFEVMPEAQKAILAMAGAGATKGPNAGKKPRKVAFESLPTFIQDGTFEPLAGLVERMEVGIGVESASDRVLTDSVNKGHGFAAFPKAAEVCRRHGVSVKAYLMCKPPFLKESDALADATATIVAAAPYSDMVSLNPTNVQGNTVVDALYKRGSYRPPWLWTIVQALHDGRAVAEQAGFQGMLKSDVIAAGQDRGAHNCGKCDETIAGYLKKYKSTQDRKYLAQCLEKVQCGCRRQWRLDLELGPLLPLYADL